MLESTPTISAIVLTRNEADNVEHCLSSLLWCDEVLLIDHSNDETLRIARSVIPEKQLRVISSPEEHDFSYLRNLGLQKALSDWVLFIDADEEVSGKLHDEIKTAIQNTKFTAYFLKRHDFFLGKWLKYGETGNIQLLKLGKRQGGTWERRVHEVWNIPGSKTVLHQPLFHYPHPTVAEFMGRINRWTTLDVEEFKNQGVASAAWKIAVYPTAKFFLNYFLKLGFLDGMPGLIMATCMSFHSFLTRAKLYVLEKC